MRFVIEEIKIFILKFKFLLMNSKFLFLAAIIIAAAAAGTGVASEKMSSGVQEYYLTEANLSNISSDANTLKKDIGKIEQDILPLNEEKSRLESGIREANSEIIDAGNNIDITKKDAANLENKKGEFKIKQGTGYTIGNMIIPFAIGFWISIVILIFVWKGE